ncbi:MAG TPA: hypothetical protein EYP80_03005, partial [Candidatus Aenigmarchaeota archaeon]|nr:hypothetical protein [Candidatus Aenigmarchaeota archaeon]
MLLVEGDNYQNINNITCWILSYGKLLENSKIGPIIKEFLKKYIMEKENAIVSQKHDYITIFFLHYPNDTVISNLKGIDITDEVRRAPSGYPTKSPYWEVNVNVDVCELINLSKNPYIDKIDMLHAMINKKVRYLVIEQVFYRKLNDTVRVYLHFFNKPNNNELSKV